MTSSNDCTLTLGPYIILDKLGSGSFATVYRCEHARTHRKFAGKLYDLDFAISDSGYRMVRKEVSVLKLLRGPRVIHFQEVVYTREGILVVMELVEGRTLLNVIPSSGGLPESFARQVFRQVLEALRFLHCNGIVHRDIKLENIMIQQDGGVKIIDFGLADYVPEPYRRTGLLIKNRCGSPHYYAPEMIISVRHESFQGDKVDIWAAGVLLYSLVSGFHPFYADDEKDDILFEQITNVQIMYDSDFSRELENLLRKIFVKDPSSRASLQDLLNHPWTNNTALTGASDFWIQEWEMGSSSSDHRVLEYSSLSEQRKQNRNSNDEGSFPQGSRDGPGDTTEVCTSTERSNLSDTSRRSSTDVVKGKQEEQLNTEEGTQKRRQTRNSTTAKNSVTQDGVVGISSEFRIVSFLKSKFERKSLKSLFKRIFRKRSNSNPGEDRVPIDRLNDTQTSGSGNENRPSSPPSIENRGYSRDAIQDFDFEGRREDIEDNTATGPYCKFTVLCWGNI